MVPAAPGVPWTVALAAARLAPMAKSHARDLREQLGLDLDALAELADIDARRLAEIEGGAEPFLDEVVGLARALAIEPREVLDGVSISSRSPVRFRTAALLDAHALAPADVRLLARAAEAGRILASLLALLGRPPSRLPQLRDVIGVRPRPQPWKQGYALGDKARKLVGERGAPLASVQRVLEELGVHVAFARFTSDTIDAASLYEHGASPVVVVNTASKRAEQRLSRRAILAHELCHLLYDGGTRDLLTIVSRHDEEAERVEQRANGFAPSFIAPRASVGEPSAVDPTDVVMQLGTAWGLSFRGAVWHAKNLQLITAAAAEKLGVHKLSVDPAGFELERARVVAPGDAPPPSPLAHGLLSDVAIATFERGAISAGRLREILEFE
jgi:Zn-dependent peptidase ImmA (M78 family)/transcriptional regulator with XRE-family HTH domain